MAQAVVIIAGRTYRMNCDEGEEPHIESLARLVDDKIAELRGSFGEIGDQRITVMAALTIADELAAARKKIADEAAAAAQARAELEASLRREQAWAEVAAESLDAAAEQVEAAIRTIGGAQG